MNKPATRGLGNRSLAARPPHSAAVRSTALSKSAAAGESPTFDELIAPLEQCAGERLNGIHRRNARAAHALHPDGVARCVELALQRGDRYPVGLFVRRLGQDVHVEPLEPPGESARERPTILVRETCLGCTLEKLCRVADGEPGCDACLRAREASDGGS